MKLVKLELFRKCLAVVFLFCSTCVENKKEVSKPLKQKDTIIYAVLIADSNGSKTMKAMRLREGVILDNEEIWVLGSDGYQEKLYYSVDRGASWQKKVFTNIDIPEDITFTKNRTWLVDGLGYMYYSTDRGDSWIPVTTPNKHAFTKIIFHQNIGYAIVNKTARDRRTYTIKPGIQVLRTTDGGQNWKICYEDWFTSDVIDLALWQENVVIVVLDDKTTLWTSDQGKHWKIISSEETKFIWAMAFNKEGKLWAVAREQGLYYSIDKGQSWQHLEGLPPNLKNKRWLGIAFNKKDYGVCSASDGTMLLTKNGGQTWEQLKTTIVPEDSGDSMKVMMGEKFIVLNKNGEVYRIALPESE
jgi:photosystem II stability/assembly factor-like uncharacterized protein